MLIVTDLIHFTQSPQRKKGAKSSNPLRLCILSLRFLHETLLIIQPQHSQKSFLRHFHISYLPHPLFTFFLFFQ